MYYVSLKKHNAFLAGKLLVLLMNFVLLFNLLLVLNTNQDSVRKYAFSRQTSCALDEFCFSIVDISNKL